MSIYSGPNPNLRNQPNGVPNLAVPEGSPSLYIDFVNNQYETVNNGIKTASSNAMSLITFTRSSNASYIGSNGLIKYAANNEPRFDYGTYSGFNGYCKGLLIEEQSTNYILNSQNLSTARIGTASCGSTFTDFATGGPDGGAFVRVTRTSLTGISVDWPFEFNYNAFTVGWTFNFSCYVRSIDSSIKTFAASNPDVQYQSVTLTPQWTRASFQFTAGAQGGLLGMRINRSNADDKILGCSYDVAMAQIETLPYATSYILTTGSAVTRFADDVYFQGTNLNSWFNQTQGTFCFIGSRATATQSGRFISNQNFTPEFLGGSPVSTNTFSVAMFDGNNLSGVTSSMTLNATARLAGAYTTTSFYGCAMGGTVGTAVKTNNYPLTPASTINIAKQSNVNINGGGANNMDCTVQNFTYYPVALSASSLQQITS